MKLRLFTLFFFVAGTSLFASGINNKEKKAIPSGIDGKIEKALKLINVARASAVTQLDSMYNWEWSNGAWEAVDKYLYTYDANHNLDIAYLHVWNGTAWENSTAFHYTYDALNKETVMVAKYWNGTAYIDVGIYTSTYDANSNLITYTRQNFISGAWQNALQFAYTYDANNNRLTDMRQNWNNGTWVGTTLHTYTYDINNNKSSDTWEQYTSMGWDMLNMDLYSYNSANIMLADTMFTPTGYGRLYVYSYDSNNNCTLELRKEYSSPGPWNDFIEYINSYDANNNRINRTIQYIGSSSPSTQYIWDYDANNNQIAELYQQNFGINSDSIHYYYGVPTGISENNEPSATFTITPNPASDYVVIMIDDVLQGVDNTIKIVNTIGQEVLDAPIINNAAKIYCAKLKPGVYFVHINSDENYSCKKLVVE